MTDPVIRFPPLAQHLMPDPEEMIRRQHVEATRLAGLTPGEWQLWIDDSAARLGVLRLALEAAVKAIIAQREKDKRERKAEEEQERHRAEKAAAARKQEKARAFKTLDPLPEAEQEKRLDKLAKDLGEDPAVVREEFATSSFSPPVEDGPDPWPESVATAQLLDDLTRQIRRFVVIRDDGAVAAALFTAMTWIHDAVAVHSPILGVLSADYGSGRTTLMGTLGWMVPRPFTGVELTGPSLYRVVDRDHPTLLIDEADDLLRRRKDLAHIVNASWTRGTKIPRAVQGVTHWFDPFCPKIIGMKGAKLPRATASRLIPVKMLPRLPEETIEDFPFADGPEFIEIRRKAARWAADHGAALGDAKPEQPPGFHNRLAANWRLLFVIADHAVGDWPERARLAAVKLSRQHAAPSQGRRLLAALQHIFMNRAEIPSDEIVKMLAADPTDEWCEFGRGRSPITQRQLAIALQDYDIVPVVIHPTKRSNLSRHGYRRAQFKDAFARFLPHDPNIRTQLTRPTRK